MIRISPSRGNISWTDARNRNKTWTVRVLAPKGELPRRTKPEQLARPDEGQRLEPSFIGKISLNGNFLILLLFNSKEGSECTGLCLSRDSGSLEWSYDLPPHKFSESKQLLIHMSTVLLIAYNTIIIRIRALDIKTGNLKLSKDLENRMKGGLVC